jgi:hypothetical protein
MSTGYITEDIIIIILTGTHWNHSDDKIKDSGIKRAGTR